MIANLMHNDRRIGAPILLEAADIRIEPTGDVRGFSSPERRSTMRSTP